MARIEDRQEDRRSKLPTGSFTSFTPLTAPINQVLMQIKDEGALTFPSKLKGDPNKKPKTSTAVSTMITVITCPIATT